ncbi:hypothetical protein CR513_20866, partial [Mucuna pruriens]
MVHKASVRCLSQSRRYMTRIWEVGSCRRVRDRVNPTPSHLSYSQSKPDRFLVSRDQIAESRLALASLRPSWYFHIQVDRHQVDILQYLVFSAQTLISTLSHNLTHYALERIDLGSSSKSLHAFDPKIERTLHRLRKVRHTVTPDSSSSNSIWNSENSNFTTDESNFSEHQEAGSMENNDRTLKELATPDVVYQSWCIQCPPLEPTQSYELKSNLIHLLPKFHGLVGEDPNKHLKEFHVVCSTMRPHPGWSYKRLVVSATGSVQYLGDMKCLFLEKFFLGSRTTTLRKEICGIKQHSGKTLHEYWERFNKLCATCPHHQISEQLLVQYFYEGLMMMDRSMIDVASGGALMDKRPTTARHLISNMASNMQ